jgi:hypothetical protein
VILVAKSVEPQNQAYCTFRISVKPREDLGWGFSGMGMTLALLDLFDFATSINIIIGHPLAIILVCRSQNRKGAC